jgi:hypothetical protein
MANTIKTLTDGDITREALRIFKNANSTLKYVNRQYDDRFAKTGAKNGGTLQIRLPNRYTVGTGRTITPQDTTERTTALVVATQKHVPVQFFSDELTLSLDDFSERILQPAMSVLASNVAADVALKGAEAFTNYVGTPGTTPSSFLTFAQAGEMLDWQTAPRDGNRAMILNPTGMAATADSLKGLFNPGGQISEQYRSGMVDKVTGWKFDMDQSLPTIAHGAGASYTTHGTTVHTSGTAVIAIITGTGALKAGQQFTIAGMYEVNPDTKASTGKLKTFTVGSDYAGGAGNLTLSEPIYTSGAYQNVSTTFPTTTALTLIGSASTSYTRHLGFHRDALVLATADLEIPKGVDMSHRASMDGLSLRFIRDYDVTTDNFIGRFDILYGVKVTRPNWGCVVYGA